MVGKLGVSRETLLYFGSSRWLGEVCCYAPLEGNVSSYTVTILAVLVINMKGFDFFLLFLSITIRFRGVCSATRRNGSATRLR